MNIQTDLHELYNKKKTPSKIQCTDEYGFLTTTFQTSQNKAAYLMKEKWYKILEKYQMDNKKYKKSAIVKKIISYGIPIPLKYTLWKIFVKKPLSFNYEILKNTKNEYLHQIHVDVQRTFRSHFLFAEPYGRGQSELFNILAAFSNFMPKIGYCQGMSSFVGVLLMYFPEEEAFEMMVCIIKKNELDSLFDKNLSKIDKILKIQTEILKSVVPEVLSHLLINNIEVNIYATSWYLTLFTRFNIRYVLRFWDLFLYMDFNIFLYITCSLMDFFSDPILKLKGEQLAEFMSKIDSFEFDIEFVIINSLKLNKKFQAYNYKI